MMQHRFQQLTEIFVYHHFQVIHGFLFCKIWLQIVLADWGCNKPKIITLLDSATLSLYLYSVETFRRSLIVQQLLNIFDLA
jgi:hypothetical protein